MWHTLVKFSSGVTSVHIYTVTLHAVATEHSQRDTIQYDSDSVYYNNA